MAIASLTVQLCTVISLGILSYWEHRNTVRPSVLISVYLILTSILDAARARTQSLIPGNTKVAVLFIVIVVLKLSVLAIETKEKSHILLPEYSELSSELRSSLLSRALFLWLNPLLLLGFRGVLASQDLPPIYEKLSSEELTSRIQSGLMRGKLLIVLPTNLSY